MGVPRQPGRCGSTGRSATARVVTAQRAHLAPCGAAAGRPAAQLRGGLQLAGVHHCHRHLRPRRGLHGHPVCRRPLHRRPRRHRPPPASDRDRQRGDRDRPGHVHLQIVHATVTTTTSAKVARLPPGGRPRANSSTARPSPAPGQTRNSFRSSPPHYARPTASPRSPTGSTRRPWKPLPANRVFATGTLALGSHRVQVRTSNHRRHHHRSFGWQVVALPAPAGVRAQRRLLVSPAPRQHRPPDAVGLADRAGHTASAHRRARVDIYDIDGFLTTPAELERSTRAGRRTRSPIPGRSATSTSPGRTIAPTPPPLPRPARWARSTTAMPTSAGSISAS